MEFKYKWSPSTHMYSYLYLQRQYLILVYTSTSKKVHFSWTPLYVCLADMIKIFQELGLQNQLFLMGIPLGCHECKFLHAVHAMAVGIINDRLVTFSWTCFAYLQLENHGVTGLPLLHKRTILMISITYRYYTTTKQLAHTYSQLSKYFFILEHWLTQTACSISGRISMCITTCKLVKYRCTIHQTSTVTFLNYYLNC